MIFTSRSDATLSHYSADHGPAISLQKAKPPTATQIRSIQIVVIDDSISLVKILYGIPLEPLTIRCWFLTKTEPILDDATHVFFADEEHLSDFFNRLTTSKVRDQRIDWHSRRRDHCRCAIQSTRSALHQGTIFEQDRLFYFVLCA